MQSDPVDQALVGRFDTLDGLFEEGFQQCADRFEDLRPQKDFQIGCLVAVGQTVGLKCLDYPFGPWRITLSLPGAMAGMAPISARR